MQNNCLLFKVCIIKIVPLNVEEKEPEHIKYSSFGRLMLKRIILRLLQILFCSLKATFSFDISLFHFKFLVHQIKFALLKKNLMEIIHYGIYLGKN